MIRIPDAASNAAMHLLSDPLFRRVGGSTRTNFFGLCWIAATCCERGTKVRSSRRSATVATGMPRPNPTLHGWPTPGSTLEPYREMLERFLNTGEQG